jgi:molecular chaperone DnaK (HSP70)
MEVIIPKGTSFPSKKFNKYFTCKKNSKQIVVRILEGDNEDISKNKLLTILTINLNEKYNEKSIYEIIMYVDCNSILKIKGKVNDEENNKIDIKLQFN